VAAISDKFKSAASTRPRLACEVRAELRAGALAPALKAGNLSDKTAVVAALESALGATNAKDRDLTLVVPDAAARVLLLDFDTLPNKRQEAMPVVRFRLRKMVPFDVESASVSYQVMGQKANQLSLVVTAMPADVLAEYEGAVRDAGYEPGSVLPSTLAVAAGLNGGGATLLVNQLRSSVTTAVTRGDEMLLHRTVDLSGELPVGSDAREEEIAQAVITALAWYEDTLRATPEKLEYAGPGGAQAARRAKWLRFVDPAPPIEDVPVPSGATMATDVPMGLTAGVVGALANA
jgi:type IV pilus assembly protein PilM